MHGRRLRLAVGLCTGVLLLLLALGTALLLERMRRSAHGAAAETAQRVARVAENTLNRHLLSVDGMLAGLPAIIGQFAADGQPLDPSATSRLLRELNFQNFSFRDLLLVRPDGRPWATALPASRQRLLPLGPAGAGPAEPSRQGTVSILGPMRNPVTGEWSLFLSRPVDVPGVGPLLAVAEVPVSLVTTFLAPVAEIPGLRLSVERADGQLLASLPHDEARIGRRLESTAAAVLPPDGTAAGAQGRFGDGPVIAAARGTLYPDLLVVASYGSEAALAEWSRDRRHLLLAAVATNLLLAALALALNAALRNRERVESERARARAVLESAIESMSDGFVMFDAEDRLVVCNQRYRDLYAVSAPFIVPGAAFDDIIRQGALRGQYPQAGEDVEAFVAEIRSWHRGDFPPMERLLPDGRWILVTERGTPGGGTVGIRTDITALKHAMADLAAARDAAAAATEAKSRFLAHMSHELRTPLNGVLGLAQALARDPGLTGDQRERARTLESAGRHLVAVANDVLDLAKVEAGRLELRPGPADLPALLEGCATLIQPAAEAKGIRLEVALEEGLPGRVMTDQTRLRQLLLNLLSNAVKFTPSGGQVELRGFPRPGGADAEGRAIVRVEVRDTGPGVPEAARSAVFGDFVQLDRGDMLGGTGLGLAIAAHMAERMGGRIGCDDNLAAPEGHGALFWIELPLTVLDAATAAPTPAEPAPAAPRPPRTGLRVLVADDVPANLAVARALLESAGHRVDCVDDGAAAVEALAAAGDGAAVPGRPTPYDLVLMDVMMPGMDGLEAARRIRALPPGAGGKVPILAATASAFAEDVEACRAAGMDAHIAKPIEREALLAVVARLLDGGGGFAAQAAAGGGEFADLPLLTRRGGAPLSLPGLDARTAREIAAEFLCEIREAAAVLRGDDAARSAAEMVAPAHRLAGAAATLGATRLATAARRLQSEAGRLPPGEAQALRAAVLAIAADTVAALEPALEAAAGEPEPSTALLA